jgi:hypothetical protein
MFLTLLSLTAIFLFDCTSGKAIDPQRNNEDFVRRDSRGMQRAKEMLWSDQANFYTNPLKSATSDGFAFERSSVPIPNDVPASIIKQHSVPNDGPAHFKQLSATMTQVPAPATMNAPKYQIDKWKPTTASNATQNFLLFFIQNDPAITISSLLLPHDFTRPAITAASNGDFSLQLIVEFPSLLLFCVKDAPAIMMATLTNFSLQLIVDTPSLFLLCDFERPAITAVTDGNFFFKFIVESISEGA